MEIIQTVITFIYYLIVGYAAVTMIYNLIREKSWEKEILYIIVLIPFILRLLRLK